MKRGDQMQKTEKMYIYIQTVANKISNIHDFLQDSFILGRLVFDPQYIETNAAQDVFTIDNLTDCIQNIPSKTDFSLRIHDGWSEVVVQKFHQMIIERVYLSKEQFIHHKELILDYLSIRMKIARFAYARSYDEFLYHNIEKVDHREMVETVKETNEHPKKKTEAGEIIVDGHYFSGYDLFHTGFCFTSCWRMYFGEEYSGILPLNLIKEVQQIDQVQEIHPNTLMVELYSDPFAWVHPQNLQFQRKFRDQLGFDQLTRLNGIGLLRDSYVEFQLSPKNYQIIQYQNDYFQPVPKIQATHFVTRTYDLETKKEEVHRVKGTLNAQAFFPDIDNRQRQLKNTIPLLLEQTVDDGLAAYEYYIRQYMEVKIQEKQYSAYQPVLTFLLPEKYLSKIPFQQLKQRLNDFYITENTNEKRKKELRLVKGEQRLRVEFLPLQLINKQKNEKV